MFNLNVDTVEVAKCIGRLPEEMFLKDHHTTLVDYKFVERRVEFRRKMWLQAHEIYYELMDIFPSQTELARVLSKLDCGHSNPDSWNTFLSNNLFARIDNDNFMLTARSKDYKVTRFGRWLIAINRKIGLYKKGSK